MADMKIHIEMGGRKFNVGFPGHCIAIPMDFNGPQPNTYSVPIAVSEAFEGGGFVGDVRRGGSCNFETYTLTPHCNGTHTECVGHIAEERIHVHNLLRESFVPATLITIRPVAATKTRDSYDPPLHPHDLVIDAAALELALGNTDPLFHGAIVIRTFPNSADKKEVDYMQHPPAFFTLQGMEYLSSLKPQHLLVDMPSVDRLYDEGKLRNHHTYWGMKPGSHQPDMKRIPTQTITEMIFADDALADGEYMLNLQIAPFLSDAAPSRPVLYGLKEVTE